MGLIAHYRLDSGAEDWIGGRDGQINGEVQWVKGVLGDALDLTGGSKWVTGDGWPITGDFSYSFWAKQIESSSSSVGGLVGNHWHRGSPTGVNVYFRSSLTQISIATANGATRPSYAVDLITPITEWCHYAVTCRGGWVSVYQNGQHLDTRYRDIVQDQSRAWAIGRWAASYSSYYEGLIDDVRIYDHALSPREVRDLSLGLALHIPGVHDLVDAVSCVVPTHQEVQPSEEGMVFDSSLESSLELGSELLSGWRSATISCWLKQPSTTSNDHNLVFKGSHNAREPFGIWADAGTGRYAILVTDTEGNYSGVKYTGTGQATDITHLVVTFDAGGYIRAYFDGVEDSNSPWSASSIGGIDPSDSLFVGTNKSQDKFFTGTVKDLRIYATSLTPAQVKELYQQRASIDSEGSVHTPAIQQSPRARYIRDWTNGSTSNGGDHWLEVRAIYAGENISMGKPVTASVGGSTLSKVTNGSISNSGYASLNGTGPVWVQVDLEEVREIDVVQVWHYNTDGRTYYDTKTEISEDGINWTTIFDSAVSGTYPETSAGVTHQAKAPGPIGATPRGLRAPDISEVGVTRGLVAWYPLIGDTLDYAGTNHAVNNGAVATAEGYEFDGSSNVIPEDNLTAGGTPGYSVSMVTRVDSLVSDFQMSVHLNEVEKHVGTSALWGGVSSGNFLNMTLGAKDASGASGWAAGETSIIPEVGRLYHVCASWDGETTTVYVDGKAEVSYPLAAISEQTGVFRIGSHDGGYRGFNGIIRDVRIHNVALTPEEVAIQAKLALSHNHKTAFTQNCIYTRGQIKEVIA